MSSVIAADSGRLNQIGPFRASRYFWVGVVLLALAGGFYLWRGADSRIIYSAAMDLPAFHQISQSDVRTIRVRASESPTRATQNRADLVGHYTTAAIAQDHPFNLDTIGPVLPTNSLSGRSIVGLAASAESVRGIVARGDRIDVLVASTATTSPRNGILRQILALDVKTGNDKEDSLTVVCAISQSDQSILLTTSGTGRVIVVRSAPYETP